MIIEKVYGLHATNITLNERFGALINVGFPKPRATRQIAGVFNNLDYQNRLLIEQIAKRLQQQAAQGAFYQRLGTPSGLRRFGSQGSLPGLRRANSLGNLSVKNRISWKQSNGNLSNLGAGNWRRFNRRGVQRTMRGRLRGGMAGRGVGRQTRVSQRLRRGVGQRGVGQRARGRQQATGQSFKRGGQRGRLRGRGGIRGRGAKTTSIGTPHTRITRSQSQKAIPSKEQLDAELDQYMSCTKAALDKELDTYMRNAMELE